MHKIARGRRGSPVGLRGRTGLLCAALCQIVLTGCQDHRISLREFLDMQRQVGEPAATEPGETPETKPADVTPVATTLTVGPRDVLRVTVVGGEGVGGAITHEARVHADGTVDLPLVGKTQVSGLTLEGAEDAVKAQYQKDVYVSASVHVVLVSPDTTEVLVTGAVTTPGLIRLLRNERDILHAITTAGGLSQASSGQVTLRRLHGGDEVKNFDLTDPDGLKRALAVPPLENGDMVVVGPATPNTVFVGGLVNAPRPQAYPPGVRVTVLQALAAAAGLRTDVLPREATLIRHMPDGRDVHVKLDLDRLGSGKDPNIELAAGDILWVPHTLETRIQEWISRNIYVRGGVSASLQYNFLHTKDILKEVGGTGSSVLIGGPTTGTTAAP